MLSEFGGVQAIRTSAKKELYTKYTHGGRGFKNTQKIGHHLWLFQKGYSTKCILKIRKSFSERLGWFLP